MNVPPAPPPPPGAEPSAPPAAVASAPAPPPPEPEPSEPSPSSSGHWFRTTTSVLTSMFVHIVLLLVLALATTPISSSDNSQHQVLATALPEREEEVDLPVELDMQVNPATNANFSPSATPLGDGAIGSLGAPVSVETPRFDDLLDSDDAGPTIQIGELQMEEVPRSLAMEQVPEGTFGNPRSIVDSYEDAMDRITQELLWMLAKRKVLTVWCFDQSESMKDDQQEIRQRIDRVYTELGVHKAAAGDNLMTAVTSFGEGFRVHTRQPTSNPSEIRAAIDVVPTDPSGVEIMCEAVIKSIQQHRQYAARTDRQMVLILVTDESGDPANNNQYLEQAVAEAKSAGCKVYVLGREAVFGYPFAYMSWLHPQTKHTHWIQIDRGPESALIEQLQTDGFRRRHDAFPSGFGPYEQTRLTRETGGVFFMLPSLESNLVRGEKRRYELEQLRAYRPDLSARMEYFQKREQHHLSRVIGKVVSDLNPWMPEVSRIIEMRVAFSRDDATFLKEARIEQQKALIYLKYLAVATKTIEDLVPAREQETSPRWQANYDLLRAQLYAYQARIYEYGAYLEFFIRNPKIVPINKPPNYFLSHWEISTRKELVTEKESRPYIDRATMLFKKLIADHPGTPWAARAEHELARGFGVELFPHYDFPNPTFTGPLQPVPKL